MLRCWGYLCSDSLSRSRGSSIYVEGVSTYVSYWYISNTYVEPLLDDINHTALVKERKINLDAVAYEKILDAKVNITSDKKKFIVLISKITSK